jgi:hypothetical protein
VQLDKQTTDENRPNDMWTTLFEATKPPEPPFRYLMERTHVRVFGEHRQRLQAKLWVDSVRLFTTPTISISIDGEPLAELVPDEHGYVTVDVQTACSGWCDLYIRLSSVAEFWLAPDVLRAVKLLELDWNETGS